MENTIIKDCVQPEPLGEHPVTQRVTVEKLPYSNAEDIQSVDVGTSTSMSTQPPVAPSTTTDDRLEACTFKRGGMCNIHKIVGTKKTRTSKSWKQRRDGTFGYVTSKKIEYTCELSNQKKPAAFLGASCEFPETEGVTNNGRNDKLLLGLSSTLEGDVISQEESESKPPDPE